MAGLASKWATDEALVESARKQDLRAKKPAEAKRATTGQSKALPSKWANDDYLESSKNDEKELKDSSRRRGRHGRRGITKNDSVEESFLPTPPRTAENTVLEKDPHMSDAAKLLASRLHLDGGNDPKKRKESSRNGRDRKLDHHAKSESLKEETRRATPREDTKRASPREDVRKVIPSDDSSKKKRSGKRGGRNRRRSSVGVDSDSDERAPLTAAGKSLLDRIGPVPVKGTSNNESDFESTEEEVSEDEKRPEQQSASKSRTLAEILNLKPTAPKKAYLTPKQRREENLKAKKEQENELARAAQAEKEARLKAEVNEIFNKMSNSATSWADLEDDF